MWEKITLYQKGKPVLTVAVWISVLIDAFSMRNEAYERLLLEGLLDGIYMLQNKRREREVRELITRYFDLGF